MLPSSRRILIAASLLLLTSSLLTAQAPPSQRVPPKVTAVHKDWTPSPQELFVPYWTLEPGWSTELELRNNVPWHDLRITPVLRTEDGTEVPLEPVNLKPDEISSVNLKNAVASAMPELLGKTGAFGSVVFRFDGTGSANAFGAAIVRREGHPIDFHFDADDSGSSALEGIWWLPAKSSTDYLILSNPTKKPATAALRLSEASGENHGFSVTLAPGQSQRINIREELGATAPWAFGGLSLSVTKDGALTASEIVFDEVTGLAAVMKLFDRDADGKVSSHLLRAPMMALSQPDPSLAFPPETILIPRIFLRNAGSTPLDISALTNWRRETGSGKFGLPGVTLMPGQIRVVNLEDFQKAGQIPVDARWGTVTLGYTGRAGDLVAVAASYDKNGRYGLQTPFAEGTNRLFKGSMWHVDGTHNTLITTGNGGSEPTKAQVTLFYNSGQGKYRLEQLLPPGQQIWLDLGQLIRNQVPDSDGKTVPPDTMFGSYELRDLDHPVLGLLYGGKLIVDKTFGHASYGCEYCCAYRYAQLAPSPFTGPPGIDNGDIYQAYDVCNSTMDDFDIAYDWKSSNTAVATLPNSTLHTVAVGSATGSAENTLPLQIRYCPNENMVPQQAVTVRVPDHLVVQSDTTAVVCTTNKTVRRDITYSEVDVNGNSVGTISTEEQFASKGTNSCNTTIATSQTCSPDIDGVLTDHIGVGCNSVGGSCGVTFTKQQWLYCPAGGTPVVFATPGDLVIHNNSVTVGGYASFPAGTKISASGIVLP